MTEKEIKALGEEYLRKAWMRGKKDAWHVTDAQVYAVGDLVRLSLDMKNALEYIHAEAVRSHMSTGDIAETFSNIKNRAKCSLEQKRKK